MWGYRLISTTSPLLLASLIAHSHLCHGSVTPSPSHFAPWACDVEQSPSVDDPMFSFLTKTGTTIVGLSCKEGVVLGADTRSTGGPLVIDKNKLKIHSVASRIFCCAAGTSADCDQITRAAAHSVALLRIERELCGEDNSFDPIGAALISITNSLLVPSSSARKPSSVMILGGFDDDGPALYTIDDSGVPQRANFAALGSGSTDAIAILENSRREWQQYSKPESDNSGIQRKTSKDRFVEDIDIETAVTAVRRAVQAGITNDLGSGSHIDICVIQGSKVRQWREYSPERGDRYKACITNLSAIKDPIEDDDVRLSPVHESAADAGIGNLIYSKYKAVTFLRKTSVNDVVKMTDDKRNRSRSRDSFCDVQMI